MRMVEYGGGDGFVRWAVEHTDGNEFRPDAKALGMTRDGSILAVVVFDNFSPGSCCISVASDGSRRWLNREFLIRVFAYPFIQLRHRRLTALIAESNLDSRRFCENCGFKQEGILREGAPSGEDMIIMGLLRSECRFLPEHFTGKIGKSIL